MENLNILRILNTAFVVGMLAYSGISVAKKKAMDPIEAPELKIQMTSCEKKISDLNDPELRKNPLLWRLHALVPCAAEQKELVALQ